MSKNSTFRTFLPKKPNKCSRSCDFFAEKRKIFKKTLDKLKIMVYNTYITKRKETTKTMKNIKLFERELDLIVNEDLRMLTKAYLEERVPSYFWQIGASSSGKYHPSFSQNVGGLVRHTKAVVMFAEELLRMNTYAYMKDEYKDYVIVACIIHDTCKYGKSEYNKDEYGDHAKNASELFAEFCAEENYIPSELLLNAVKAHMGQWSTEPEDRPFTAIDRCVHLADYMASRSFIDIPCITEEYDRVVGVDDNETLPLPC